MIQIAICDNDRKYGEDIAEKLKLYTKDKKRSALISIYTDGRSLMNSKENIDILFMDIELGQENGMEIAKEYQKVRKNVILIFLTNHEELSRKGYRLQAFRFISKQDPLEDIYEAVSSAILHIEEERMEIKTETGVIFLFYQEIYYIEAQGRYVKIHTLQETIISRKKISEYANWLESKGFYLTHRSFLVNLKYVHSLIKNNIYLNNGEIVPLSEKRKKDFGLVLFQQKLVEKYG